MGERKTKAAIRNAPFKAAIKYINLQTINIVAGEGWYEPFSLAAFKSASSYSFFSLLNFVSILILLWCLHNSMTTTFSKRTRKG